LIAIQNAGLKDISASDRVNEDYSARIYPFFITGSVQNSPLVHVSGWVVLEKSEIKCTTGVMIRAHAHPNTYCHETIVALPGFKCVHFHCTGKRAVSASSNG
jgi:hypothetical protein